MAISTNSIIHYTKTFETLEGILKDGLKVFYCYEKIIARKTKKLHGSFPMVSFCDIPLSEVKSHLASYGHYGIGLTKEWAKSNGLNPIIYFETNSNLLNYYRDEFERLDIKSKQAKLEDADFEHLIMILSYAKNYEGKLEKTGEDNYRFYDEREWRYVAQAASLGTAQPWISGKAYPENKEKYNNELRDISLRFQANDISYIIVKDESDIRKITKVIRSQFESKCTMSELEILMTRIITTDQIKNDF